MAWSWAGKLSGEDGPTPTGPRNEGDETGREGDEGGDSEADHTTLTADQHYQGIPCCQLARMVVESATSENEGFLWTNGDRADSLPVQRA